MVSLAFTLFTVCALAFAIKSTRWLGVICLALFCFLHPWVTLALMVTALGILLIYHHYFR